MNPSYTLVRTCYKDWRKFLEEKTCRFWPLLAPLRRHGPEDHTMLAAATGSGEILCLSSGHVGDGISCWGCRVGPARVLGEGNVGFGV